MPTRFFPAPEVEAIGKDVIAKHHTHLLEHNVRVDFIFRDDTPKSGGNIVLGTARKIGGHNAFLSNYDEAADEARDYFLITISEPEWKVLDEDARVALIDHELMHCGVDYDEMGETKLTLIGHDFEGFAQEIKRHGLWRSNALAMGRAMQPHLQLALFEEKEDRKAA